MSLELKGHDRAAALEALRKGEYEAIATSGQGALDALLHLAIELGVFEALEVIKVERERAGIPDELVLRVLAVLPFVEAIGLSAAAGRLMEDAAILLELGFSIAEMQAGFNERHQDGEEKAETSKPFNPEVLRQELARIDLDSLAAFRRQAIKRLFEQDLVKGRTYAQDGTGLKDRYGLVGLMNVYKGRELWVNWRLLDGDASEKGEDAHIVREMVSEIRAIGGPDAMEWLIMDALYADGPLLAWLEYECDIHALVRSPEDRILYQDLKGLADGGLLDWDTRTCLPAAQAGRRPLCGRTQASAPRLGGCDPEPDHLGKLPRGSSRVRRREPDLVGWHHSCR